jgi:hypothetical protein
LRWPWSINAADLAKLDRFVARIADDDLRTAAHVVLGEGLRRRYRLSQITCGYPTEGYSGLLGLLDHPQGSAAARTLNERGVSRTGGGGHDPDDRA